MIVAVSTNQRRELEDRLIEASYEVAPEMTDTARVDFIDAMLASLSQDDTAAILGI